MIDFETVISHLIPILENLVNNTQHWTADLSQEEARVRIGLVKGLLQPVENDVNAYVEGDAGVK